MIREEFLEFVVDGLYPTGPSGCPQRERRGWARRMLELIWEMRQGRGASPWDRMACAEEIRDVFEACMKASGLPNLPAGDRPRASVDRSYAPPCDPQPAAAESIEPDSELARLEAEWRDVAAARGRRSRGRG